jgi:hypothetical protein
MLTYNQIPIQETTSYYEFLREIQKYFNSINMNCKNCRCGLERTDMILRIINSDYKKALIVKFHSLDLSCDCKVKEWVTKELDYQN